MSNNNNNNNTHQKIIGMQYTKKCNVQDADFVRGFGSSRSGMDGFAAEGNEQLPGGQVGGGVPLPARAAAVARLGPLPLDGVVHVHIG